MFRSFHYAVYATIFSIEKSTTLNRNELFNAGEMYYQCLVAVFMQSYLKVAMQSWLDVGYQPEIEYLLNYNLLEKAIYELGYELNGRPTWAIIPLRGIMQLLGE